ncbi:VOC family protein [Candidatus Nitrospira bockiana]
MVSGLKGLWHIALNVTDVQQARAFYERLFGMRVVWQPDPMNVYLSSGQDNLALHQAAPAGPPAGAGSRPQSLDHLGFVMESTDAVDRLFESAQRYGAPIIKPLRRHRDGSYSFYVADPDGNVVQVLYEPLICGRSER